MTFQISKAAVSILLERRESDTESDGELYDPCKKRFDHIGNFYLIVTCTDQAGRGLNWCKFNNAIYLCSRKQVHKSSLWAVFCFVCGNELSVNQPWGECMDTSTFNARQEKCMNRWRYKAIYTVCACDAFKTKEPLKVLSSSGIRDTKFNPVYNFPAQ